MVRTPCCDKSGTKKGTWTAEEDNMLAAFITTHGCSNWRQLPKYAGLSRCGKSCRLRWMNYLRPNLKRGNYTQEEDDLILKLHRQLGNKWSAIAAHLPGRTDNEIKNHWHTSLKKIEEQTFVSSLSPSQKLKKKKPSTTSSGQTTRSCKRLENNNPSVVSTHEILESSQWSSSSSSSLISHEISSTNGANNINNTSDDQNQLDIIDESFWSEPFLLDNFFNSNDDFLVPSVDYGQTYLFSQHDEFSG